jgi:hypothetical protein
MPSPGASDSPSARKSWFRLTPAQWAGAVAFGWLLLTFRLLLSDPSGFSRVSVLICVTLLALAIAVFRGSRVAAWLLVVLTVGDATLRIAYGTYGLLVPIIAFAVFLRAALDLGKAAPP